MVNLVKFEIFQPETFLVVNFRVNEEHMQDLTLLTLSRLNDRHNFRA